MAYSGKLLKKYRIDACVTVEYISELLKEKGFKAEKSTIYSWENDNSQPTPAALLIMCETYGIPDVLDAFGYNGYHEDGSISLNKREIELIEKYRSVDVDGMTFINEVIDREFKRCNPSDNSNSNKNIRPAAEEKASEEEAEAEATGTDGAGPKITGATAPPPSRKIRPFRPGGRSREGNQAGGRTRQGRVAASDQEPKGRIIKFPDSG